MEWTLNGTANKPSGKGGKGSTSFVKDTQFNQKITPGQMEKPRGKKRAIGEAREGEEHEHSFFAKLTL